MLPFVSDKHIVWAGWHPWWTALSKEPRNSVFFLSDLWNAPVLIMYKVHDSNHDGDDNLTSAVPRNIADHALTLRRSSSSWAISCFWSCIEVNASLYCCCSLLYRPDSHNHSRYVHQFVTTHKDHSPLNYIIFHFTNVSISFIIYRQFLYTVRWQQQVYRAHKNLLHIEVIKHCSWKTYSCVA